MHHLFAEHWDHRTAKIGVTLLPSEYGGGLRMYEAGGWFSMVAFRALSLLQCFDRWHCWTSDRKVSQPVKTCNNFPRGSLAEHVEDKDWRRTDLPEFTWKTAIKMEVRCWLFFNCCFLEIRYLFKLNNASRATRMKTVKSTKVAATTTTTTTTVLQPFFRDHPGEPVPEENFWTLWCKGRLTKADTPTIRLGATPSRLTSVTCKYYDTDEKEISRVSTVSQLCQLTCENTWLDQVLTKYHTTTVLRPFSGTTRVSQCQRRTSGLYGARKD